jgi:hypothetical protein
MLTESGYLGGLAVYAVAALLALFLFQRWLLLRWPLRFRALLLLPLAALLLTPAYITADADTMAPALVVAAFQSLTNGVDAAMHAIRPLAVFTAAALLAGVLLVAAAALRRR